MDPCKVTYLDGLILFTSVYRKDTRFLFILDKSSSKLLYPFFKICL